MTLPFLSDEEIFAIVKPLTQPAAIIRWFKNNGFDQIKVKPNGMPLVGRTYFDQVTGAKPVRIEEGPKAEVNVEAYLARVAQMRNRRKSKA
jgi:hypothetical protein